MDEYRDNVLEGYRNGALLDLRVRFAMELMKSPMFANVVTDSFTLHRDGVLSDEEVGSLAGECAGFALDAAHELLAYAEVRGYVKELPTGTDIDQGLRDQAARAARYQVLQQVAAQRCAQDEQERVVPAFVSGKRPGH